MTLASTYFIDHTSSAIAGFARAAAAGASTPREKAARLFLAVRERVRYDPYALHADRAAYRASAVLEAGRAFCVPKAILLVAVARAEGIPARLGFCDVTNHLSTPRLLELLGSSVFAFHGYAELCVDGRWLKATPAFNASLCEKFGVPPLDFDGTRDAVLQPFNGEGSRFMEYLRDRGTYDDFPLDEMLRVFRETYPKLMARWQTSGTLSGNFEAE